MILSQLKRNGIEATVITVVILVVMSLPMFLPVTSKFIGAPVNGTPLFNVLYEKFFDGTVSVPEQLLSLLLTAAGAFAIIAMNANYELTRAKNILFILIYFVLSLSYIPVCTLLPEQVANFFIILGFIKVLSSHGVDKAEFMFFDAGLFFGLAALFCLPAFVMLIIGIIAFIIYRPYRFSELAVFVMGFFTPMLFYVSGFFMSQGTFWPLEIWVAQRFCVVSSFSITHNEVITFSLYLLMILICSVLILQDYFKYNLFSSRTYRMFFFVFFCVFICVLTPYFGVQTIHLMVMPLTMLYVTVFNGFDLSRRSIFPEVLFGIFLIVHIGVQVLWYLV